jgi:hypothetical protein
MFALRLQSWRSSIRQEEQLKTIDADVKNLKIDLKSDMVNLKADLKSDMVNLKTELKSDIYKLKTELKSDMANLKADINKLEIKMDRILFELLKGQPKSQ